MPHRRRVPALTAGTHRTGRAVAAVLLAVTAAVPSALTGCGAPASTPSRDAPAAAFSDGGVDVTLRWRPDGAGPALVATFAPQRAGYHLYSRDLPEAGVDGVGRPTRVDAGPGTELAGPAVADRTPTDLVVPGVDGPLPVYPAGPVTLTVPVRVSDGTTGPAVLVTYAACSATACLPPVVRRPVRLAPPS